MRKILTDRDLQQVTYSRSHAPDRDRLCPIMTYSQMVTRSCQIVTYSRWHAPIVTDRDRS